MHARNLSILALAVAIIAGCSSSSNSPRAVPSSPATNSNGQPATGVIAARFDPATGVLPLPNNLSFSGTTDGTLNPPVPNPNDFSNPSVAVSALDGWSTVAPWTAGFSAGLQASSISASAVRMFEVTTSAANPAVVTGVVRPLTFGTDFIATLSSVDATNRTLAIVPLRPLKERTSYMAVLTNALTDTTGNNVTPDSTYFLAQRRSPLATFTGTTCTGSTDPLLPVASACALEGLRQLVNSYEGAAASQNIAVDSIVLSWVATTQSITPVLQAVRASTAAAPAPSRLIPTGLNLSAVNSALPPIADVIAGYIDLPYYLEAPDPANAATQSVVVRTFWRGTPGNYVPGTPPFDPTSTNLTFFNRSPALRSTQRVPVVLTVPNAASGRTKPATGWPVVMFLHGITRNRTDAFGLSARFAAQGFAVIAIDHPLHGLTSAANPLFVSASNPLTAPLAALGVTERTFGVDLVNNTTGAAGPDGVPDASGTHFINLASLLSSRDNIRQAEADHAVLARTLPVMDLDGDAATVDFDRARITLIGQSLGGIAGTVVFAHEIAWQGSAASGRTASFTQAVLNVPGGGIAKLLDGSLTFGPQIRAGLAAVGLTAGTPAYESFLGAAQQVIDSGDPVNYGGVITTAVPGLLPKILMQEVVGSSTSPSDNVIPNTVAGAPLSGTEPLARALNLPPLTQSLTTQSGVRGIVRFIAGSHGSLLDPAATPAPSATVTTEMQQQAVTFADSNGLQVTITSTDVVRQN